MAFTIGTQATPAATQETSKRKREPLTFNGVDIDKKTGWQTLNLQGELADMAKALYETELAFKERVQAELMAMAVGHVDDKGKPAPLANPAKHRVMLTQNYGKWSATFADKAVRRNTITLG
jgi:hypothetical protein